MKREFKFVKFHGCGNDFLIFDETSGRKTSDRTRSNLARELTDRHFHVGADGLMFLEPARNHDCSMRLFEPAGNEAEMCGNGIRCIASYMMTKLGRNEVDILTRDGPKHVTAIRDQYRVAMGRVRSTRADLSAYVVEKGHQTDSMMSMTFKAHGVTYKGSVVNSGEPHVVIQTRNLESVDVVSIGEAMNADKRRFPKGINVNFVQVAGRHSIKIRTYERGVYDETLSCGTGATACAAVALTLGWVLKGEVKVFTRGGPLLIAMDSDKNAIMTGPAKRVFSGKITVDV